MESNQRFQHRRGKALVENQTKVNWEAIAVSSSNTTGIGMIARDCNGRISMVACSNKPHKYVPTIAEAITLR